MKGTYCLVGLLFFFSLSLVSVENALANEASAATEPAMMSMADFDLEKLSPEEREWFRKFHEGTFYAEGWQKITADILAKIPEDEREEQLQQLKELGYRIGCEWSRDNDVRKIDTEMLRTWGKKLKKAKPQELGEVIASIRQEVDRILR